MVCDCRQLERESMGVEELVSGIKSKEVVRWLREVENKIKVKRERIGGAKV